jgi:hypothetical protein
MSNHGGICSGGAAMPSHEHARGSRRSGGGGSHDMARKLSYDDIAAAQQPELKRGTREKKLSLANSN